MSVLEWKVMDSDAGYSQTRYQQAGIMRFSLQLCRRERPSLLTWTLPACLPASHSLLDLSQCKLCWIVGCCLICNWGLDWDHFPNPLTCNPRIGTQGSGGERQEWACSLCHLVSVFIFKLDTMYHWLHLNKGYLTLCNHVHNPHKHRSDIIVRCVCIILVALILTWLIFIRSQ